MYPFARLARQVFLNRRRGPLGPGETHVIHMRAWPVDIDPFLDVNNGRILTLMDLGRIGLFSRLGIAAKLRARGWHGTVAGTAVQYRRRITVFQRLELRTRIIGWDARFLYFDQTFWRGQDCCAQAVVRTAITSGRGIVPTADVADVAGYPAQSPPLPDWVLAWDAAERARPWPPERDEEALP